MCKKAYVILAALVLATVVTAVQAAAKRDYVLVIDAGHGGHDAGARGTFSKEKDLNLKVALAFGRLVEKYCSDVRVVYTRKTDVFVPLSERADIANKQHADVFISIHTNAIAGRKPMRGLETYTMGLRRSDEKLSAAQRENGVIVMEKDYKQRYAGYDPNSPESQIMFEFINDKNMEESVRLAQLIQSCVCRSANRQDKGVKQDVFLVLRETSMPACLVELGYITTPDEERYLNTSAGQQAIAQGLYRAFCLYKDKRKGAEPKDNTPQPAEEERAVGGPTEEPTPEKDPHTAKGDTPARSDTPAKGDTPPAGEDVVPVKPAAAVTVVFRVQYMTSGKKLRPQDKAFKGVPYTGCYREGGVYKYTVGESSDYQEMVRLRRQVARTFPQAFVAAFRDGQRMDLDKAISASRR